MCVTCGCSDQSRPRVTDLQTGATIALVEDHDHHDHHHDHDHNHHHHHHHHEHGERLGRAVSLETAVLARNDELASRNRGWLAERRIVALNLVSSPGAGKTTLLERTIRDLSGELPISVVEGDQETLNDAERIRATGCRVVQINTGTGCHLDASMVARGLQQLDPPPRSFVLVENVGNLVCPALFDLGERAKVVIASVTEGEDKPLKYPHMFRASSLLVLNKIDLLPYVSFDEARFLENARQVNPTITIVRVSATRGDGLDGWYHWLRDQTSVVEQNAERTLTVLCIRGMTVADIPAGMRLKAQAGWNQLEADWRRLLDVQPDSGFVAEIDGTVVGTVVTCRFGPVAWVAMMLVEEQFRGRGIGRTLLVHALEDLDARGILSVRLDATPLGRPLYESLGFEVETVFTRYQGILPVAERAPGITSVHYRDVLERIAALDRDVTGTDRGRVLDRLVEEHPRSLRVVADEGGVTGFLMSRPGAQARQIGPCIAQPDAGPRLFDEARQRYAGESVFIDIPDGNAPAAASAGAMGLTAGRYLSRMGRGPRVVEDLARLWASAGPEKG